MSHDYLSFNVSLGNLVEALPKVNIDENEIDAYIREKNEELKVLCEKEGLDSDLMNLLFGVDTLIKDQEGDSAILDIFRRTYSSEVATRYTKIMLDRYALEYLMRRGYQTLKGPFGDITEAMIETSKNVQSLIAKTPYFKALNNVKIETLHKEMDEYLFELLRPYRYVGVGVEGIVAKILIAKLYLQRQRVQRRLQSLNIGLKLERDYEN